MRLVSCVALTNYSNCILHVICQNSFAITCHCRLSPSSIDFYNERLENVLFTFRIYYIVSKTYRCHPRSSSYLYWTHCLAHSLFLFQLRRIKAIRRLYLLTCTSIRINALIWIVVIPSSLASIMFDYLIYRLQSILSAVVSATDSLPRTPPHLFIHCWAISLSPCFPLSVRICNSKSSF